MPFDDWNSGTDVVYSGVTSITAALSGPYASTGKIATTAGLLDACTDLYTESDESAVMSKFVRRRITRLHFKKRSSRIGSTWKLFSLSLPRFCRFFR